ncbi:DUF4191 domain-containing protein [Williamsia muralis]|uniref:DUF4191 domain-containing protein n=1 Tax=Williamsia marianensis TaxID=85044 RepID=A0A2G3PLN6_WILMA|nr:DUF4191 domain-containing protein [Williamsia marianensis]PHV66012.1 hypothetical protein CSW57_20380 [Williamsia marianensis]PZT96320.1 MAG: DUF4191 domain-containing protein [Gordonia sp. (in: high G+C Gram-positive bacteria)]
MAKAPKATKEAKAAAKAARKEASRARRKQLWQAFQMQRKEDKLLLPYMIGAVVLLVGLAVLIGVLTGSLVFVLPLGIVLGVLIAFIIFGRRVQKTVFTKAEGQAGAAAWALDNMRGQWRVKQAVTGTAHLDAIHRVIGKPGVILVAEGAPHRTKSLLAQEKKRIARLVGDTPIYDVTVGNDEGQVPLKSLERHLNKLPNNINKARIDALESRLAALGGKQPGPGMPKGPMPQGAKMRNVQRAARRR